MAANKKNGPLALQVYGGRIKDFRKKKEVGYMPLYDLASRFSHAFALFTQ